MVDQTSQFYAILTQVGAAKQANADALGIPWKITQMAVGDGNPGGLENPPLPMPSASATALLNEWRRAPLNQLKVDDKDNSIIVAEQVIPADVGGRWIREVALFDADGDMVAVANCAPTYKPLLSQGSGRTQVVRMNLIVSSSSNVQLKIDPSVVLATREWVTEELAKQDFKHSALVATTAAITLSGLQTVDGVALSAGARVLVKNQAAGKDNGLYLVVAGGAWTRCADVDTSAKVTPGMLVPVEKGTINADSTWQLVTDGPITLGVTTLAFEMAFGRTGVGAGTYRSVTVDAYGRVVAATNPTTVAGYGLTDVYTKTQIDQALALKAPLASPALTGTPTAPTAAAGTNSTQLANTAFVTKALLDALPEFNSSAPNIDWNTIVTPGWFPSLLSASSLNSPGASTPFYYCLVLKYSTNLTQIAYPYGTVTTADAIFHRSLFQGTWGRWNKGAVTESPEFTGVPTAPTAAPGSNGQQLANTAFVAALGALKANLANPTFTGSVSVPNVAAGNSSQLAANTSFVMSAIAALVSSSPAALDTLNELAAAIGNDPNFATTMVNQLALKAPLASPALTGAPTAPTLAGTDVSTKIANAATVRAILARFGLGSAAYNYTGDIDTIAESGVYMVSAASTGTKPEYPVQQGTGPIPNGTVFHMERGSSNMATQFWDSLVNAIDPVTCMRTRNANGVWTKWEQITTVERVRTLLDTYGLGAEAANQPLITNFSHDIRPGLYRAFSSGSALASIGCPPDTGDTSMSVMVGGGYVNPGYKTFLAIINGYTATRVFVGVKVTAGVQPTWTELTTRDHAPFAGTQSYRTAGVFTWHVPVGVKKAWVTVIGGGGGGGRSGTANIGSGGGGGGGLAQKLVDLTGMTSVAVTVGEGGAGATVAGGAGETGGTSSFGAFLSATGGTGGMGVGNSVANGPGPGGVGSGGDFNTGTGVGHVSYGHWGGSGGGAGARSPQSNQPGSAGGTGGGGSGATYGYNGGAGGTGTVLIQW